MVQVDEIEVKQNLSEKYDNYLGKAQLLYFKK